MEFKYLVFTHFPDGVTVDSSGVCFCVLCLMSAIISLQLLSLPSGCRPHSVSDDNFMCVPVYMHTFFELHAIGSKFTVSCGHGDLHGTSPDVVVLFSGY